MAAGESAASDQTREPASTGGPVAPAAEAKPAKLDDIMIAMDVVDTVRHRNDLVNRELNDADREAELIKRLKEIYRLQGIDVPDSVLAEGVKALKESRFTYTSPPAGWKRRLLTAWVRRGRYGTITGVVAALLAGSWGVHYVNVERPALLAEEQTRIELTKTLPEVIRQAHGDVVRIATEPAAHQKADQLLADGERAIRDKDRAHMTSLANDLRQLRDEVARAYTLTIVSRPGETSGVWRKPPKGSTTRNYYLIVEPIGDDGRKLSLPIRNEENGQTETVDKFGVRVPQATFDAVSADKRDDGIIQKNKFAHKQRGKLTVDYDMPFEGGMITRW